MADLVPAGASPDPSVQFLIACRIIDDGNGDTGAVTADDAALADLGFAF